MKWGNNENKTQRCVEDIDEQNDDDELTWFSKRSLLFNLEYWKHILVQHNIYVMHIEKNVCEILIVLML